jgi:hypothetical protein
MQKQGRAERALAGTLLSNCHFIAWRSKNIAEQRQEELQFHGNFDVQRINNELSTITEARHFIDSSAVMKKTGIHMYVQNSESNNRTSEKSWGFPEPMTHISICIREASCTARRMDSCTTMLCRSRSEV